MSPLGPVGVASFGSIPWVSRMCRAAGLKRNLQQNQNQNHVLTFLLDNNTAFYCFIFKQSYKKNNKKKKQRTFNYKKIISESFLRTANLID